MQKIHTHPITCYLPMQVKPMGSHNSSFATKRGLQTPVKSNPLEAVELNDLVNLEVCDGADEGAQRCQFCSPNQVPALGTAGDS